MEREGGSCRAYVLDNSKTLGIMVLNVAAVVGIVVVMKQLFQGYHYDQGPEADGLLRFGTPCAMTNFHAEWHLFRTTFSSFSPLSPFFWE